MLLIALLLLYSAIATGLRINGTPSFPLGFYFAVRKRPEKGTWSLWLHRRCLFSRWRKNEGISM